MNCFYFHFFHCSIEDNKTAREREKQESVGKESSLRETLSWSQCKRMCFFGQCLFHPVGSGKYYHRKALSQLQTNLFRILMNIIPGAHVHTCTNILVISSSALPETAHFASVYATFVQTEPPIDLILTQQQPDQT